MDIIEEKKFLPLFSLCLISLSYFIHTHRHTHVHTHTYRHTNGLKFFMNKVRV